MSTAQKVHCAVTLSNPSWQAKGAWGKPYYMRNGDPKRYTLGHALREALREREIPQSTVQTLSELLVSKGWRRRDGRFSLRGSQDFRLVESLLIQIERESPESYTEITGGDPRIRELPVDFTDDDLRAISPYPIGTRIPRRPARGGGPTA